MSVRPDIALSAFVKPRHRVSGAYQAAAAGALDASEQELSAHIQPLTRSFAQRTLPPGWWLLPAVAAGGAIWGLIIWWLL